MGYFPRLAESRVLREAKWKNCFSIDPMSKTYGHSI